MFLAHFFRLFFIPSWNIDPLLLVFFYRTIATAGLVMNSSVFRGGFTLVELLVVIVIMGILSTVAVPKLFGQIAKAKVSELVPSAGAYISLQNTYNIEHEGKIGSWKTIGYSMNSNTNIKYSENGTEGGITPPATYTTDAGETAAWKAENKVPFSDCVENSVWQIDVHKSPSNELFVVYDVKITGGAGSACAVLTNKFTSLDTYNGTIDAP
jgi:prepilin-type N-terminal cleavage/methylation domain-containing protein